MGVPMRPLRYDKLFKTGVYKDLLIPAFYVKHVDGKNYPFPVVTQVCHYTLVGFIYPDRNRMYCVFPHRYTPIPAP